MKTITDRALARRLGYKPAAGGFKAARQLMASRGVYPLDERRPATFDLDQVDQALKKRPPHRGNFTSGANRRGGRRKTQPAE